MTGYGKGQALHQSTSYIVEVRSVNHRFSDISVQLPRWLKPFEQQIRRHVQNRFERGRFEVSISVNYPVEATDRELKLDKPLAEGYIKLLKSMKKQLRLSGKVNLGILLQFRDIIKLEEREEDAISAWPGILAALDSALTSLQEMRSAEGKALHQDISERLCAVQALLQEIKKRQPEIVREFSKRLRDRVTQLLDRSNVDLERLEQEVVIFAERNDISEEVARLEGHIMEFTKLLDSDQAVGRKLDFLLQEIHREINTAASKASDLTVSHAAVNMKTELEKIRQQAQNVE